MKKFVAKIGAPRKNNDLKISSNMELKKATTASMKNHDLIKISPTEKYEHEVSVKKNSSNMESEKAKRASSEHYNLKNLSSLKESSNMVRMKKHIE